MACGTPVVATDVGGIPEVLNVPAAGEIVAERTADGIARAVRRLLARAPDREDTRSHARKFSWQPTAAALKAVLERAAFSPGSRAAILRA
jgi:glycosyltransferase involved in cell wall biosynthesis